ncbi:MAG: amidohydrolase family protein [Actinobacteria bacterium]|nr:amidohydrolase family protein [Actinomycetota bacterium]MCG2797808.1 amidohydrolase family protein [Cellulomonas sp.]
MTSTLYRHGVVHSSADPFAEAILVADGAVAWLGADDTADGLAERADEVVDLQGAIVTPGFVDAHVHLLETALALDGVDLSAARSLTAALDLVRAAAQHRPAGAGPLLGHGWQDQDWPEGRPPSRSELDAAAGGLPVYLARADVHSGVVSSALAHSAGLGVLPGWRDDGLVTGAAHHAARDATRDLGPDQRLSAYRRALGHAAQRGVVSVHEMSAPHIDTRAGLRTLLELTAEAGSGLPLVIGYRGELCITTDDARALAADLPGLTGIAGDLNVDGSIGSHSARLRHPYADAADELGVLHLTAEKVANHVAAVTRAGLQAGFHVIGDAALDEVLLGVRAAADVEGLPAIGAAGHRLEHVEMVDAAALAALVLLGMRASVQPAFDAVWGAPGGLYAQRLGPIRAAGLNPFADLTGAGVPLAFGSDTPVTPLDPWAGVRAAYAHHQADQRISVRGAFRAATRGGWRLAGLDHTGAGELRVGAPAHLAVWACDELVVQAPEGRFTAWSADARAGTPVLPSMAPDAVPPTCLRTVRAGVTLHDQMS